MSVYEDAIAYVEKLAKDALKDEDVFVSVGGSASQLRSEFLIRELPESITFDDPTTSRPAMGRYIAPYRIEFNVACEAWCKKASLTDSTSAVMSWMQKFEAAVMGDRTLGGLVVHAQPYAQTGGTARDTAGRLYTAAYDFGVHVKADIAPQEG